MVGQQVREQHCRRDVRREVLQGGDERRQLLLHPHVDIDRGILLDLAGLQETPVIVILCTFLGLFAPNDNTV